MKFYEELFIRGIPISILVVIIGRKVFLNIRVKRSINWLRLILIISGGLNLCYFFYTFFSEQVENKLINRINGDYGFAYILMIFSNTLLPLLLFWSRLGKNLLILLAVSLLMNLGRIFESLVMITTSIHRDFGTFSPVQEIEALTKGLIIGLVVLGMDLLTQKTDLKFIDNDAKFKINYRPLLLIISTGILYSIGDWQTSIYGFDSSYGFFYSGLILKAVTLLTGLLLIFFYLEILLEKGDIRLNENSTLHQ